MYLYNLYFFSNTDIRFGAEDQYTAAGTQNVESHAKFEQGSSKNKFGAKPPRQAPSYTSQGKFS